MNQRYSKKLIPFPARFNEEQRVKVKAVAEKLGVSEAEALRVMIETYGN